MIRSFDTNNSTLVRTICAIVFILFTFTYLYFFQADLLFAEQHVLSGGTTHYNRTIGAFIITVVLYSFQLVVNRLVKFTNCFYALTYFPSLLLLMLLTAFYQKDNTLRLSTTCTVVVLGLFIFYIAFYFFYDKRRHLIEHVSMSNKKLIGYLWKNILLLSVMLIMVCAGGNTDKVFHYRLRMERLFDSFDYFEALQIGDKSDETDPNLTMLRVYALSKTGQLGERLFEYPLSGGSNSLLPDHKKIRCMFFSETEIFKSLGNRKKGTMAPMEYLLYLKDHGLAMKPVTDYLLCGYLLDKDLDGFVREFKHKYNSASPFLPKHYKEALTLYTHLRSNPILVFHNEVMDVDYADFQKLERKYVDKRERISYVRDLYGGTYWFYYFYN